MSREVREIGERGWVKLRGVITRQVGLLPPVVVVSAMTSSGDFPTVEKGFTSLRIFDALDSAFAATTSSFFSLASSSLACSISARRMYFFVPPGSSKRALRFAEISARRPSMTGEGYVGALGD